MQLINVGQSKPAVKSCEKKSKKMHSDGINMMRRSRLFCVPSLFRTFDALFTDKGRKERDVQRCEMSERFPFRRVCLFILPCVT